MVRGTVTLSASLGLAAAAIAVGLLGGCATPTENVSGSGKVADAVIGGSASAVVGRIDWRENGEPKKIGQSLFEFFISPNLVRIEDKARSYARVGPDGEFAWTLAPGTYVMYRIHYRDAWTGNYFLYPNIAFRVPDKGKTYYVGTLHADFAAKRGPLGGLSGQVKVTVEDGGDGALAAVATRLSVAPASVQKSLMVHDANLPQSFETSADFDRALQLLGVLLGAPR